MNTPTPTLTDETMPKKEFQQVRLAAVEHSGGMKLAFNNFADREVFAFHGPLEFRAKASAPEAGGLPRRVGDHLKT